MGVVHDASRIILKLAEEADADPRSVVRFLAGLPVRGRVGRRLAAAAARLGIVRSDRDSNPPPHAA
jgi:hypothetical protein